MLDLLTKRVGDFKGSRYFGSMNDMPMMVFIECEWFSGALQGMSGGPHGPRKDQFGSGTLPGNLQHSFGGPEFPPTRFNHGDSFPSTNLHIAGWVWGTLWTWSFHLTEPSSHHFAGHMHPGDPNLVADYGHHGFPTESAHFGLVGH